MKAETTCGPFKDTPLQKQIEEWNIWCEGNKRPEEHPAIRHFRKSPPEDMLFEILGRVSVQKERWSDGSDVQCNVCRREHKFKKKGYIASYENGWWYIVGPYCGSEHHHKSFSIAKKGFMHREVERIAEGSLNKILVNKNAWKAHYCKLGDDFKNYLIFYNGFRRKCPKAYGFFKKIARDDGQLKIVQQEWGYDKTTGMEIPAVTKPFALLEGNEFFQVPNRSGAYRKASDILKPFLGINVLEDALENAINVANKDGSIAKLDKNLKAGLNDLEEARKFIIDGKAFLDIENLKVLRKWTRREDCVDKLKFNFKNVENNLRLEFPDDIDQAHIEISKDVFREISEPPS